MKPNRRRPRSESLALLGGKPARTHPFTPWPLFDQRDEKAVVRTLRSGKWGCLQGSEVAKFEKKFATAHGCKHGIAVANGTVSLRIALLAAGLSAHDEVIIPSYSFFSTASAVVESNMVPVFADISLDSFNLDPRSVAAAITPRTRALIPVHFAGQCADMRALTALSRKHDLFVLEDAAHAHGARHQGRSAGALGHIASFSFQSSKNLTAGEGGILTTNDDALAERCRSIRNCGRTPTGIWYEHHVLSGNYRLGEFQGAVLNSQLDRLEAQTRRREANGKYLARRLSRLPGIFPQKRTAETTRHSYHLFMLRLDEKQFGVPRVAVLQALKAEGIPCSPGYGFSLHQQPFFRNKAFGPYLSNVSRRLNFGRAHCPNSDLICREQCVWLEQSILLGTRSDIEDIASAFEKVYENRQTLNAWAKKIRH